MLHSALYLFFCRQIPLENLQGDYYPAAHGTQKFFFVPHTQPRQEFQNAHRPRHLFSEKLMQTMVNHHIHDEFPRCE